MSTALTTNGLVCGASSAQALTTNGLICFLLNIVVVPFVPTFIVPPQTVVPFDIYNKQRPGVFSSPAVLASISKPTVIFRKPFNIVKTQIKALSPEEAEVYNKEGSAFNKQESVVYNKKDPEIIDDPEK